MGTGGEGQEAVTESVRRGEACRRRAAPPHALSTTPLSRSLLLYFRPPRTEMGLADAARSLPRSCRRQDPSLLLPRAPYRRHDTIYMYNLST